LQTSRTIEKRFKKIEERLKRIEDELELSPAVTSFDWKEFSEEDKKILGILLAKERLGATTTEISEEMGHSDPEGSGRVLVYRKLKRIERVSKRVKGFPIVTSNGRRWSLNYDDFHFHMETEKQPKPEPIENAEEEKKWEY
jgi:hypothetical protein